MKWACAIAGALFTAAVFWAGGCDFDERGPMLAAALFCSALGALLSAMAYELVTEG